MCCLILRGTATKGASVCLCFTPGPGDDIENRNKNVAVEFRPECPSPRLCRTIAPLKLDWSVRFRDGKEIVFIWGPGHVSNRGNSAADSAAKDALDGDISAELISFSDVKSRINKYVTAVAVRVRRDPRE